MTGQQGKNRTFDGYSLHIPREIIRANESSPLLSPLQPLQTGLYRKAWGHEAVRTSIDEYVMLYCIDGSGRLELAGSDYRIEQGHIAVCPSGRAHKYKADEKNPWSIYWLHFKGDLVEDLLEKLGLSERSPLIPIGVNIEVIRIFREIGNCYRRGYGFPDLYHGVSLTHNLFSRIMLIRSYSAVEGSNDFDMESIRDLMAANIESTLTLDDIAGEAGSSKYHFSRKFKAASGLPPMAYFNHMKIQKACELLDTTGLSVKEISSRLSFNTPYYFSETFKRITGLSPAAYRMRQSSPR